ncbi:hypothetical protein N7453_001640, partial [Penicillium expansum]
VEKEQARRGACVEWIDLEYSTNLILKQVGWESILRKFCKIDGYLQITFASPVEKPQRLWIIIREIKTGLPELIETSFISQMR